MNKLFPIVLALLFFGCGDSETETKESKTTDKQKNLKNQIEWNYKEQQKFLEGCKSGSTRPEDVKGPLCLCLLDYMMEEYSFEEWIKEEGKLFLGNVSDEYANNMMDFVLECGKEYHYGK